MADPAEVTHLLNVEFKKLLHQNEDGTFEPHVCSICDRFIVSSNDIKCVSFSDLLKNWKLLTVDSVDSLPESLVEHYFVDGREHDIAVPWEEIFLSNKTKFVLPEDGRRKRGVVSCADCESCFRRNVVPKYAISNGFYFGVPPLCLTDLTEVEVAFLTPVKTYGFCFSYSGGFQKELKGSLSYYRVRHQSIARVGAHFSVLGLESNIVVLLHGEMTAEQREKARKKNKLRTNFVLRALEWLISNNCEWQKYSIDLNDVARNLKNPTLVDDTSLVDSSGQNIEEKESFQVFFPDGGLDVYTGGQEKVDEFRDLVMNAKRNGFNVDIQADLLRTAVSDYKDNNLVNACLMQFPYGRGGLNERRQLDNKRSKQIDLVEYVSHLARIQHPHFHHELFVLILYNMKMKLNMVRGATWRVRNTATAQMLATELCDEDIELAVRARKSGHTINGRGEQYLKAIDAVARGVAHTNEAAKKARRDGECLQHHFGMPSIFLTVTPDDDNSLLVEVLSGLKNNDGVKAVDDMSDDEVEAAARRRTEIRLRFPGVCAYAFDVILELLIKHVIGWDVDNNRPYSNAQGLFGTPIAFTASVEEQGRRTLHVHFQIWIKELIEKRNALFDANILNKRAAEEFLCGEADRIMTTHFFNADDAVNRLADAFPHECLRELASRRSLPVVVDDQKLREMRYKEGADRMFAYCPNCTKTWTNEELVRSYLVHGVNDVGVASSGGDIDFKKRMKAKALEYQQLRSDSKKHNYVVDVGYNWHCHTKSCFQRAIKVATENVTTNDKQRMKKRILECECRYRLPARKKIKTIIQNASPDCVRWYSWRGTFDERHVKELCIKRRRFDLFQNQSCPAISQSKLTCNTNINMLFYGSTGQYSFKYCMKNTQKDDREEFDCIIRQKDRILSRIKMDNTERAEATRRLLLGAFTHQRANICGGPMSSFLTRNKERFIFSHCTVWIPLRDLEFLLLGREVSSTVTYSHSGPFFQCSALHYLTRPAELENVCAFDFYSKFEVICITKKTAAECFEFKNTENFRHPSYRENRFIQGVRERNILHLGKIFQYDFPDTAEFAGDLLCSMYVCEAMETYSKLALLLFLPYREHGDLILNGKYTYKLRTVINTFKQNYLDFLQNVQDAKANCFRNSRLEDDLQRNTIGLKCSLDEDMYDNFDNDAEEHVDNMTNAVLDQFINDLEDECAADNVYDGSGVPPTIALAPIKDKGRFNCGYTSLATMNGIGCIEGPLIVHESSIDTQGIEPEPGVSNEDMFNNGDLTKGDIVRVILEKRSRISRSFCEITGQQDDVYVLEANGTVYSVVDWANKARLDKRQRRAFEIIVGTFLLTFYDDVHDNYNRGDRHTFVRHKRLLLMLTEEERRHKRQLLCLLHGPGGSGKSTVIDLVIRYAKEYCSYLQKIEFNSRTIVVTALSGVAATMLGGETTHKAVFLNQKKALEPEQIELWEETRLLIVDEVSFASRTEFEELDKKLRRLKQRLDIPYGGLSVIFSGDFRQLEPVGEGKKPVYKDPCPEFNDWINCYVELDGMHRFRFDLDWGELLQRFRDGTATPHDIDIINSRVVNASTCLPENLRYATYFNVDRDAINTALFEKRCQENQNALDDSIIIFSDNLKVRNGDAVYKPFRGNKLFWEHCGEDDLKTPQGAGRLDPVLRLYKGCRLMLPSNIDVKNGQANGTQTVLESVMLKHNATTRNVYINENTIVKGICASDVSHLVMRHLNPKILPPIFHVYPKEHSFRAKVPKPISLQTKRNDREILHMKATQFGILINNATTGHKLQGSGVDTLFVHSWSYVKNWVYVMLSRVRTLEGLFLRQPLSADLSKYQMCPQLRNISPTT